MRELGRLRPPDVFSQVIEPREEPPAAARVTASRYLAAVPKDSFSHSAVAAAPVDQVWDALDQPETWEAIGGVDRVTEPVIDADGRLRGFSFEVLAAGKMYVGKAVPLHRECRELIAWAVETREVRGSTTVELNQVESGTRITVNLELESRGLLATMFFPVIATTIGKGLPRSVEEFAAGFSRS